VIEADADHSVGVVLRDGFDSRGTRSIADLTGIGATDAAVASAVVGNRLSTQIE
jgi:ornithine cyclodeaminase